MKNPNRPKKGSQTTVEPIRKPADIKNIKKLLQDSPRNLCLFVLGINTNLRASDLLKIKVFSTTLKSLFPNCQKYTTFYKGHSEVILNSPLSPPVYPCTVGVPPERGLPVLVSEELRPYPLLVEV